jgi:hypothetical protein
VGPSLAPSVAGSVYEGKEGEGGKKEAGSERRPGTAWSGRSVKGMGREVKATVGG